MVDHAPGCAKAARNNRHNNLRDWWLAVIREAGGRALHEQAVHEYAPHRRQRSDVRASYGPGAPTVYYDVVVAHPFTTGVPQGPCGDLKGAEPSADAAIQPAANRKRSEYAPPRDANGTALAGGVKIVPVAFDTFGRWGKDVSDELKLWARRRLARPDAIANARRKGVYAELLSRWRATAACTLQRGNFEVYADCVGLAASHDETPPGGHDSLHVPPHFLDYMTCSALLGR